jgi:alanine racemase
VSNVIKLSFHHPTVAEIDLDAFHTNVKLLKQRANQSLLLAVVKTNAYGHGIVPISQEAVLAGADRLGVTTVEEGAMLRANGIKQPIHILSSIAPRQAMDIVAYNLIPSISSFALAKAVSDAAVKIGKIHYVHLKIDTGLHRFGIDPNTVEYFCESCNVLANLYWEGIYTHFSNADEGDWETTEQQFALFMHMVDRLKARGFHFPIHHVAGSTITLERLDMHLDMVRPGISLFGYTPAIRQAKIITLQPVMSLRSELIQVRELPPNTPVGYGGSYVTSSLEKIAIVPIGHGDGYKRSLVNHGEMLVRGIRVKIVGSISLDQTLIDVTNVPNVSAGDEIVLLGKQGNNEITARDLACWMYTIVDEVVASLTERIRRVYVHGNNNLD